MNMDRNSFSEKRCNRYCLLRRNVMKHKLYLYSTFTGCLLVLLGFIQPWYVFSPKLPPYGAALSTASGLHLWLGSSFEELYYAPDVVPAFFALLWIVPLAVLLISTLRILELALPQWNDQWLYRGIYIILLVMQGIFLGPALFIGTIQFGLFVCLIGWLLILLGVLTGFASKASGKTTKEVTHPLSVQHPRRSVLRGLVGIVGLASIVGTSGALLWKTWRTHTSITTYRYRTSPSSLAHTESVFINTVDWSPDGKRILVTQLSAPPQSWDALTGEERQTYQPVEADVATWSPDGHHIALSQRNRSDLPFLTVVNATTGALEAELPQAIGQTDISGRFAWSPDGQYLALGDDKEFVVKLWSPTTGTFNRTYTIPTPDKYEINWIQDLVWSPDGQYLAATIPEIAMSPDGHEKKESGLVFPSLSGVYIWHSQSGDLLFYYQAEIPSNTNGSLLVSWSPDGKRFACANRTSVQIVDLALQKSVLTYTGHALEPTSIAWSPDGQYIASSTYDWTVQVWESETGIVRFLYQGHTAVVTDVAWSPDGKYLASCGVDGTAQVWQPEL